MTLMKPFYMHHSLQARAAVKQQIEEDRRRRAEKAGQTTLPATTITATNTSPNMTISASNVGTESSKKTTVSNVGTASGIKATEQCRVQV